MPDTLTTITNLITSPPAQIAAGGVLAGIVWKFFEKVEAVLTDDAKLRIAVWLLELRTAQKVESWPETFANVFDRVFGKEHLSWKCFLRSSMASCTAIGLTLLVTYMVHNLNWYVAASIIHVGHFWFLVIVLIVNVVPDYLSSPRRA